MSYGEFGASTGSYRAAYRLNGNGTDASGNGYNLTATGGSWVTCKFNQGFSSSGVTNRLNVASDLGFTSGSCTFSFWVKVTTAPTAGNRAFLFQKRNSTNGVNYDLVYYNTAGTMQLAYRRVREGVAIAQVLFNHTLSTTLWTYLTMTYDGTNIRAYVNAEQKGVAAASGTASGSSNNFWINSQNGGEGLTAGAYDEFLISTGVWSAADVRRYYNAGIGRSCPRES